MLRNHLAQGGDNLAVDHRGCRCRPDITTRDLVSERLRERRIKLRRAMLLALQLRFIDKTQRAIVAFGQSRRPILPRARALISFMRRSFSPLVQTLAL